VKQGQQIPIQTNINNTVSVQFVDAVLKLEVTPQVTADGTVFLDVSSKTRRLTTASRAYRDSGARYPSGHDQSADHRWRTVVIGGVVTNSQTTPLPRCRVGQCAVDGNLFKHTTIDVKSQELLFFRDASNSAPASRVAAIQYQVTREETSVSSLLFMHTLNAAGSNASGQSLERGGPTPCWRPISRTCIT